MISYKMARRSFLASIGGAFGLRILLENMEARASMGATSPARFLLMHWPIGTYRQSYVPTGTQTAPVLPPMLAPFQPLLSDTIILYGLRDGLNCPGGGGHEAGTPFTTTCANGPGTRANGGEGDDGCAGGPSFDQIFLNHPDLQLRQPGPGYINTLADGRVDSLETSTRCLSYDYATQSIDAANTGGQITEHTPLLPELSPSRTWSTLFSGFVPSDPGNPDPSIETTRRSLLAQQSVLDHCMSQVAALQTLAPGSERDQIEAHLTACRNAEMALQAQIDALGTGGGGNCTAPTQPGMLAGEGQNGSKFNYGNEETQNSDEAQHEAIGKAHAAVILAAFQCDIIRVATFQWSPGTNHVSFAGMYPASPENSYMHHPMSHRIGDSGFYNGPVQTGTSPDASLYQFLVAAQTWYNQKTADILQTFKTALDGFGNPVLDYTVIPFVTEVGDPSHARSPKGSMIFGGRALGMRGGQFLNFGNNLRPQVDVYLTAAQALFQNNDPLGMLPSDEKFNRNGAGVINGLWEAPAV